MAAAISSPANVTEDRSTWSKSKKKRMRLKQKRAREEGDKKETNRRDGGKGRSENGSNSTPSSKRRRIENRQSTKLESGKKPTLLDRADVSISSKSTNGSNIANSSKAQKIKSKNNGPKTENSPTLKPKELPDFPTHDKIRLGKLSKESPENSNANDEGVAKKKKKKKKKKNQSAEDSSHKQEIITSKPQSPTSMQSNATNGTNINASYKPKSPMSTLQKAFLERLTSSRFRELNEELYTHSSQHSFQQFSSNPELFEQYHVGFRKQVKEWPMNPVDVIYKKIVNGWKKDRQNKGDNHKKELVVADFGCGDAKLAERLMAVQLSDGSGSSTKPAKKNAKASSDLSWSPFKVHSFDLVSGGNPLVTPADMSNVPLSKESVDVAVYCLALMGTNVADFVREAWRVLKFGGAMRVAEVRSRFETVSEDDGKGIGAEGGKFNKGQKQHGNQKANTKNKKYGDSDGKETKPLMLIDEFLSLMERCGFENTNLDRSNKMFVFMDFIKVDGSKGLSKKETFSAKPCIYKRR